MLQVEQDLSVSLWHTGQGWIACVTYHGMDNKIGKHQDEAGDALHEAMKIYDMFVKQALPED